MCIRDRKIIDGGYINDPTVNVQFADMKISVIGEVARPGFYDVTRDKVSIFDALAMAGDMTVYGVRSEVAVTREVDGVRTIEYLDLTSTDIFNSPAFYLQQNDIVYVEPKYNKQDSGDKAWKVSTGILSLISAVCTVIWATK